MKVHFGQEGYLSYLLPIILLLCGGLIWVTPAQRPFYAVIGLVTALYSLIGLNLGGFGAGMILGHRRRRAGHRLDTGAGPAFRGPRTMRPAFGEAPPREAPPSHRPGMTDRRPTSSRGCTETAASLASC